MRLVTWKIGHRSNGHHAPDGVIEALNALEPDMVVLAESFPAPARQKLLTALAAIGLEHQLAPQVEHHRRPMLIASRMELAHGELQDGTNGCLRPSNVLHAYAPGGGLDVLGLRIAEPGASVSARHDSWEWLLHAAAALKHRRAVLVGDFELDPSHDPAAAQHQLRRFTSDGWQHAVQADGADYRTSGDDAVRLDHAFLSPSLRRIDARHVLAAAGFRLAGTKDSIAQQPALVVDLQ